MASKKYIELQEFTDEQVSSELEKTVTQFQKLKFDHTLKGLENPLALREVRRDIARLKTEARRRQVSQLSAEQLELRSKTKARRRTK
jgi:large subunit ribosomal protein L29